MSLMSSISKVPVAMSSIWGSGRASKANADRRAMNKKKMVVSKECIRSKSALRTYTAAEEECCRNVNSDSGAICVRLHDSSLTDLTMFPVICPCNGRVLIAYVAPSLTLFFTTVALFLGLWVLFLDVQ
ncbi:hypothetical protein OBBRIDRAFT_455656 [Obba rivulosa]|uniref:Uncharacterized protein n=1 Tax=Obba rivulosa TaxID=1052685 RepID=A0A8E2DN88_9APHY|nr:hypothetical protein OBBRIDRAFT_455656 [Obba rivulosa]